MLETQRILLGIRDAKSARGRLVRFARRDKCEALEPRMLLTASPIQFGAVYVEQDLGSDASPDTIEVSFVGGADGTQLTRIELDGDQFTPGLSLTDIIFDTAGTGLGADLPYAGQIAARVGEFDAQIVVEDGSSRLVLHLDGFDAGEKLRLAVDVDEVQGFDADEPDLALINEDLDPIASGAEFQGTQITAYFSANHFHDTQGTAEFRNRYDENFASTALDLPADDDGDNRDRTAGAVGELLQSPLPISISGLVYEDSNANLQRESGDHGIGNVELALFSEAAGAYVFTGHTVTTNSAGEYSFGTSLGLLPGEYQVRETQPDGYFSVGAEIGTVAGVATGSIATPDILTSISMPLGGTQARDYNFAEARVASIRGRVHLSTPDGDCWTESVAHEPVAGATVLLLNAAGETVSETLTDRDGRYEFVDLRPGEYSLVEITPEHLIAGGARAGVVDGQQRGNAEESRIAAVELLSGDDGVDFEFCDHQPATIRGSVYHDRDNDGLREVGEEGIANAILSLLDENGLTVDTVETNEDGRYEFVGVRKGNYRVIELQPNGWLDGLDRAGTASGRATGRAVNPGDAIEAIYLLWGDEGVDYDFGEQKPSSLAGRVHLSTPDGDCWNIDEGLLEPVASAVVQLLDATGRVLAATVTDANGNYVFDDLAPGEYGIREMTPTGLQDGGAHRGQVGGSSRGHVNGRGDIVGVRLNSDEVGTNYDFCEHEPATLSGYVFADRSNDGIRDQGENPIVGVIIQLVDENGNLMAETATDDTGKYIFDGLPPGKYALRQVQPTGYLDGLDSVGNVDGERRGRAINPGDQLIDISLGWGETGQEYNFGEILPAALSGFVHSSPNTDCWEDHNATLLAGVRILLLGENGRIVAETRTDSDGHYSFEHLTPGRYSLVQEQPADQFDGAHRAGSNGGDVSVANQITQIELATGDVATNYDFCEKPPATLSGYVFVDGRPIELDADESLPIDLSGIRSGEFTSDDQRLPAVRLELRNGISGAAIDASHALPGGYPDGMILTETNALGYYEFTGLPSGNYAVYEIQPDGYIDGIDTPGSTDGIAINPLPFDEDDVFIETVVSALVVPPQNDAIVRIGLPSGAHSVLNNFSEVSTVERVPFVPINPEPTPFPPEIEPELPALYQLQRDLAPLPLINDPIPSDGSSGARTNTWHLSVIDGGQPRVSQIRGDTSLLFPTSLWRHDQMASARWEFEGQDGEREVIYFGVTNSLPITGDFNGDGSTEVGVFSDGHWFIDLNGNGRWDSQDLWAKLGHDGDMPVVGDWDGDGKDDIGIFGRTWPGDTIALRHEHGLPDMDNVPNGERKNMPPSEASVVGSRVMKHTARGQLRVDVIDHVFLYGTAGDIAVAGDWNGDGIDTVGVFRSGMWRLDVDGNGQVTDIDEATSYGRAGDVPIVGDFNGDGLDDLGIIRNGKIYLDTNGNREIDANDLVVEFDESKGFPIVGKWAGDRADRIGVFKPVDRQYTVANRLDPE